MREFEPHERQDKRHVFGAEILTKQVAEGLAARIERLKLAIYGVTILAAAALWLLLAAHARTNDVRVLAYFGAGASFLVPGARVLIAKDLRQTLASVLVSTLKRSQ